MQIAILAGGDLVRVDFKDGFRDLSWAEELPADPAVIGNCLNPLDIMLLLHGMGHTADPYLETTLDLLDYRDMFFFCRINGVLGKQFHRRAATDKLPLSRMQHFHDISTDFTLIDLQFFCHDCSSRIIIATRPNR